MCAQTINNIYDILGGKNNRNIPEIMNKVEYAELD
jgi:hypothetical protein